MPDVTGRVRVRRPVDSEPVPDAQPTPIAIPTLRASGVIVSRTDLVTTLRALVPGLRSIATSDDGELFFLLFDDDVSINGGTAG